MPPRIQVFMKERTLHELRARLPKCFGAFNLLEEEREKKERKDTGKRVQGRETLGVTLPQGSTKLDLL